MEGLSQAQLLCRDSPPPRARPCPAVAPGAEGEALGTETQCPRASAGLEVAWTSWGPVLFSLKPFNMAGVTPLPSAIRLQGVWEKL